jgi:hypothetical protein
MVCVNCGSTLPADAVFCSQCGHRGANGPLPTSGGGQAGAVIAGSEAHRGELRKHKQHTQLLCLECGFDGLMGVEATKEPWFTRWWFLLPVAFTGIGLIWVMAIAVFGALETKEFARCPNCKRLIVRGGGKAPRRLGVGGPRTTS